jgi:hypothetical protein
VITALLTGCVVYEPYPVQYPAQSNYDRAWSAAMGALQDTGVSVLSTDAATGVIRGSRDGSEVTVSVVRQADGSTRIQINARGAKDRDPGLADRISDAFDRRMAR